jgi:exodeoxyribonuclease-3
MEDMNRLSIVTWNVNGLRAAWRKGFEGWLADAQPDLVFLQEIRALEKDLIEISALIRARGYEPFWNPAAKPGYAGTGLLTRMGRSPQRVDTQIGLPDLDLEGRTILAYFADFAALGAYFPNGTRGQERLEAKERFYRAVAVKATELAREYETVILCGDLNTAHTEIDLAYPGANVGNSGFLPQERVWIDDLLKSGFLDTFRDLHPGQREHYTWWSPWGNSKAQNTGWRFDYLLLNRTSVHKLVSAHIDADAVLRQGISDHAPLTVRLKDLR